MGTSDDVLGLVQAGGKGSRMDVLTRERAKPVLPFGGVYHLIDFTLSSLAHSRIVDVWVSVQYQVSSLDTYLSGGRPWDLDRRRGGFRRVVPESGRGPSTESGFAHGNADLLIRLRSELERLAPDTIVVSSADHVFAMDLRPALAMHRDAGATCTLITADVTKAEASANVVVHQNDRNHVTSVEVKPTSPDETTVATEIFIYDKAPLLEALDVLRARHAGEDDTDDTGLGDFGEQLLPELISTGTVLAVPMDGYWRDVGRPDSYLRGHLELLAGQVDAIGRPGLAVMSHWQDRPAARARGNAAITNSLLAPGCDVDGEVTGSVLGHGVVVEKGAVVRNSVIFDDVYIEAGARLDTAIVDTGAHLGRRATVGAATTRRYPTDEEITLVGSDSVIGPSVTIDPGGRLEPGTTA